MLRPLRLPAVAALLAAAWGAWAASPGVATGPIYSCTDASGRRLTSDRPIVECLDREQKVLNPSGTLRGVVPPSLTATERTALEERERRRAEEQLRQLEERRMQRALIARYPTQAAHDLERSKALQTVQESITSAERRILDLQAQQRKLNEQTEFYKSPAQWPPKLRHQFEENQQQTQAQQRFIAAQQEERTRLSARFDEELARLKMLWAQRAAAANGAAPAATN
jgi:hypothetical protein